jgi:hypothetical protein
MEGEDVERLIGQFNGKHFGFAPVMCQRTTFTAHLTWRHRQSVMDWLFGLINGWHS